MSQVLKDTDKWCPYGVDSYDNGGMFNRNDDGTALYECLGSACMAYIDGDEDNRGGKCKLMEK
jgi:hypothetical protein